MIHNEDANCHALLETTSVVETKWTDSNHPLCIIPCIGFFGVEKQNKNTITLSQTPDQKLQLVPQH